MTVSAGSTGLTTTGSVTGLRLRRLDLAAALAGEPDATAHRRALVRRGAVADPRVRQAARATLEPG